MSKLSLLERIIFSENFDKFHYMNNFQKSLCPDDINAFFILAEEDIRIDEFIEADLSSITYGELRPDKIGINLDTGEYYHVEFESTGPSRLHCSNTQGIFPILDIDGLAEDLMEFR